MAVVYDGKVRALLNFQDESESVAELVVEGPPSLTDAELNTIGRALEGWASDRIGNPAELNTIVRQYTETPVTVTP